MNECVRTRTYSALLCQAQYSVDRHTQHIQHLFLVVLLIVALSFLHRSLSLSLLLLVCLLLLFTHFTISPLFSAHTSLSLSHLSHLAHPSSPVSSSLCFPCLHPRLIPATMLPKAYTSYRLMTSAHSVSSTLPFKKRSIKRQQSRTTHMIMVHC